MCVWSALNTGGAIELLGLLPGRTNALLMMARWIGIPGFFGKYIGSTRIVLAGFVVWEIILVGTQKGQAILLVLPLACDIANG